MQLQRCGYDDGAFLFMRPDSDFTANPHNYSLYKTECRRKIKQQHRKNILMCIGDSIFDFAPLDNPEEARRKPNGVTHFMMSLNPARAYLLKIPRGFSGLSVKLRG